MTTYATLGDLQERYEGNVDLNDESFVTARLGEAERLVKATMRARGVDLDAAVTAGRTTADDVRDVVCGMVIRTLRNPTGATSQTAGPFSMTVDPVTATGKLWLSREDRVKLGLRPKAQSAEMVDDVLPWVLVRPPRHWRHDPDDWCW